MIDVIRIACALSIAGASLASAQEEPIATDSDLAEELDRKLRAALGLPVGLPSQESRAARAEALAVKV